MEINLVFGLNSSNQLVVLDVSDANFLNDNDSLTITFLLNDNNGKTSLLEGTITGADSFESISNNSAIQRFSSNDFSLLDAVYNRDTSWYKSSWFGDFYPGKDGWLYHNNLGWLFLHPSGHNGFWIWDTHYQSWWWSSKAQNIFPYFYIHGAGEKVSGWAKFENLDSQTRVYEYFNTAWTRR